MNDLEKQFFDTFGIEPRLVKQYLEPIPIYGTNMPDQVQEPKFEILEVYPLISDRHLLELICILSRNEELDWYKNIENLKECILKGLIFCYESSKDSFFAHSREGAEELKHQVQALFEER